MQITEEIGNIVNSIVNRREIKSHFDQSLADVMGPAQRVDYVVGLVEDQMEAGKISKALAEDYQKLKTTAPIYFNSGNGTKQEVAGGWDNCHMPVYGGN